MRLTGAHRPVLGFAARSGTGKTTLLRQLVPALRGRGIALGVIKHAHHSFEVDRPGKDSYELRKAGAARMLVASRERFALMVELEGDREPTLDELLCELDHGGLDLVLVEGFKHERFPKIEVHRPSLGRKPLFPDDSQIVAVASNAPLTTPCPLPLLDLDDVDQIARFVIDWSKNGTLATAEPA